MLRQAYAGNEVKVGFEDFLWRMAVHYANEQRHYAAHNEGIAFGAESEAAAGFIAGQQKRP